MASREIDRNALMSDERLEEGYVIILPGIEGYSRWPLGVRKGLVDAGVPYAIEIHDWTYGRIWFLWNLRDKRRHREQAERIAGKIADYRQKYPGRPVYLIGHSGGGAMTAYTLECLPDGASVTAGILMVPALSPWYNLTAARQKTERGLWTYSSYGDCIMVGAGTLLCGNCDGWHSPGSGMLGFWGQQNGEADKDDLPPLTQLRYQFRMVQQLNIGGHLSCVNPRFIAKWIAPIVKGESSPAEL